MINLLQSTIMMVSVRQHFGGPKLSVISYNLLAPSFAKPLWYTNSDIKHLDWSCRCKKIEAQFKSHNADLVCLQELQESDFKNWLKPYMRTLGYDGVMYRKHRENPYESAEDGCATFFKENRFNLISENRLDYSDYARKMSTSFRDEVAMSQFALPVHNVGILCQLKQSDGKSIWLVNTHLHWNRKNPHTQLFQVKALLTELSRLSNSDPFIICGDFNSVPGSAVHEYLKNGYIDTKSNHFGTLCKTYSELFATTEQMRKYMEQRHEMQYIKSAYCEETMMMPFTKCVTGKYKFRGIIDYIWYSSDQFTPISLWKDLISREENDEELSLPNENHPSDHLLILAEFEEKKNSTAT